MVFAFLPAVLLVQAGGTVNGQHFVAGVLHEQALLGRVHALERVGGREGVHAVADEHARVIHGQVGQAVLPGVGQVLRQAQVTLVNIGVARGGGEAHTVQLVKQFLVDFRAEQAAEQAVRCGTLLNQLDKLVHGCLFGGVGVLGHD